MTHRNTVEFEVSGAYALFSDPIMRVGGEKSSLQIPTYEALKGILSSVYWKPTIVWYIDAVRVMNPIRMEVKGIRPIKYNEYYKTGGNELAYYTYLKDCRYQVRAHFEWNENRPELAADRDEHKHHNIARRMIERGGRRDVFLGTRECQGYVEPCVFREGEGAYDAFDMDFGMTYHGITYADEAYSEETKNARTVRFFQAKMKKGVVEFPRPQDCVHTRRAGTMAVKPFGLGRNQCPAALLEEEVEKNGHPANGLPHLSNAESDRRHF